MTQRKNSYRAALRRDEAAPRAARVTTLHSRYVRVTIELAPELHRELTRLGQAPAAVFTLAGATISRTVNLLTARLTGSGSTSA